MAAADLERVSELRRSVRWCTSPGAFDLVLRSIPSARWAVAEARGGIVVGMVGAVPLGQVGLLCHLAVHPTHRGRGLGTRLSCWATSYLRSSGAGVVRLESTRETEGLYEALGFCAVGRRVLYRLEAKPRTLYPPGRGRRVVPLRSGDLAELYDVDRRSYGGDRSALLAAIVERRHGSGLVARDAEGSMTGFLLRSGTLLGPWAASTPEAARGRCSSASWPGEHGKVQRSWLQAADRPTGCSRSWGSSAFPIGSAWSWVRPRGRTAVSKPTASPLT
jgi:predicted N-acetyltransferase YhbS